MLSTGAFTVVGVADDAPFDARALVGFGDLRHRICGAIELVDGEAATAGSWEVGVLGRREKVVGDVLQVAAIFVPWSCWRDVIGRAFSLWAVLVRSDGIVA